MTDTTAKPIGVSTDVSGKYSWIDLPDDEVARVRAIFDTNQVGYWVEHGLISFDGGPFMAVIHLRRKTNPKQAQAVLDATT